MAVRAGHDCGGHDRGGGCGDQAAAFGAGDLGAAFGFASPTIRGIFGTPENFGRMVAGGAPMIWRPDAVSYLGLREEAGRPVQRTGFRGAGGAFHLFDYLTVVGPDGWRIDGVVPVPDAGTGVRGPGGTFGAEQRTVG